MELREHKLYTECTELTQAQLHNWLLDIAMQSKYNYTNRHEIFLAMQEASRIFEVMIFDDDVEIVRYYSERTRELDTLKMLEEDEVKDGNLYKITFSKNKAMIQLIEFVKEEEKKYNVYDVTLKKEVYVTVQMIVGEDESDWDARYLAESLDEYEIDEWSEEGYIEATSVSLAKEGITFDELSGEEQNYSDIEYEQEEE